jgi:hypothetical protein
LDDVKLITRADFIVMVSNDVSKLEKSFHKVIGELEDAAIVNRKISAYNVIANGQWLVDGKMVDLPKLTYSRYTERIDRLENITAYA